MPDMSARINRTLKALRKNYFDARLARTTAEANQIVLDIIPRTARIGVGHSATLWEMGILEQLAGRGNEVMNPFAPEVAEGIADNPDRYQKFIEIQRRCLTSDVFIAGANALTEDGKIVSIDGGGNRVAGMIFGAPQVVLCVGRNKIVKDEYEAEDRIKNVITLAHTRHFDGTGTDKTPVPPCVAAGKCVDCKSLYRHCNIKVVLQHKSTVTELAVVLIDEDLGLGWDPDWEEPRIEAIYDKYVRYSPRIKFPAVKARSRAT